MRLFLVRHGESEANRAGTLDGYADAPLTERGSAQAAQRAELARAWNVANARLITSPLKRARHTADALAATLSLSPIEDACLVAGEGRTIVGSIADALREASAEVAQGIEALWPDNGDLIAVSHRFPIGAFLVHIYDEATADALVAALGNGDALEIPRDAGSYAPALHHKLT